MDKKPTLDISVVIPLYNEEESLPELCDWIHRVMIEHNFSYEVLLIDDGSKDGSWDVVTQLHNKYKEIKGIQFNRNYGKSAALHTGFQETKGDVIMTMDADLQDSPDEIPDLYTMIKEEGYDLVSGWKKKRYDPLSKTIPTKLFNGVTRMMSGIKLNDFNCGLKAYSHRVTKSIEIYGDMHRFIPVIAKWAGFTKIGEKEVEHRARQYGVSKFGLERFIHGFLDLMSITFVSKFKKRPMHFFGSIGTISLMLSFFIVLYLIGETIYSKWFGYGEVRELTNNPSFFIALTGLVIGMQLFIAGFLGEMIQLNSRSQDYLIRDKCGLSD